MRESWRSRDGGSPPLRRDRGFAGAAFGRSAAFARVARFAEPPLRRDPAPEGRRPPAFPDAYAPLASGGAPPAAPSCSAAAAEGVEGVDRLAEARREAARVIVRSAGKAVVGAGARQARKRNAPRRLPRRAARRRGGKGAGPGVVPGPAQSCEAGAAQAFVTS